MPDAVGNFYSAAVTLVYSWVVIVSVKIIVDGDVENRDANGVIQELVLRVKYRAFAIAFVIEFTVVIRTMIALRFSCGIDLRRIVK